MTTAYVSDARYIEHDFPGHVEHAGRIQAVWEQLDNQSIMPQLLQLPATSVSDEQILSAHSRRLLQRLNDVSQQDRMVRIDQDTYGLPVSLEIARLAAGGVVTAVDAVLSGAANNAMAVVRPPGHHATPERAMGFCLLNNIALAARHAQERHDISRILIIDYDVHHGNGTQDIFYDDASVLFVSLHQSPFYPGTGHLDEIGAGAGRGFTLNLPITAGHGDGSYQDLFEQVVDPAARRFEPELMLISAGFDAHWVDPLASMRLSLGGYDWLARRCIDLADQLCGGKIVFVMEGGYDLPALAHGWCNIASALLGQDALSDPYGAAPSAHGRGTLAPMIEKARQIHDL